MSTAASADATDRCGATSCVCPTYDEVHTQIALHCADAPRCSIQPASRWLLPDAAVQIVGGRVLLQQLCPAVDRQVRFACRAPITTPLERSEESFGGGATAIVALTLSSGASGGPSKRSNPETSTSADSTVPAMLVAYTHRAILEFQVKAPARNGNATLCQVG
jgi:hypothetical protein